MESGLQKACSGLESSQHCDTGSWIVGLRPNHNVRLQIEGLFFHVWLIENIIRHGRDHKLIVWKVNEEDEAALDKTLPVDANDEPHRHPWLLHALSVNTLNFCPFAMCRDGMPQIISTQKAIKDDKLPEPILIAVPNTIDSGGVCGHIFFNPLIPKLRHASYHS